MMVWAAGFEPSHAGKETPSRSHLAGKGIPSMKINFRLLLCAIIGHKTDMSVIPASLPKNMPPVDIRCERCRFTIMSMSTYAEPVDSASLWHSPMEENLIRKFRGPEINEEERPWRYTN